MIILLSECSSKQQHNLLFENETHFNRGLLTSMNGFDAFIDSKFDSSLGTDRNNVGNSKGRWLIPFLLETSPAISTDPISQLSHVQLCFDSILLYVFEG